MRGKKEIPKELYEIYMKNMTFYAFKMYSFIQGKPSRCRDELLNFVGNAIVEDSVRKGKKTMNSMACISILKGFMLSIQVETGTCNKIDEHMAIEEYESVLLGLRDMADDVVDGDIKNIIKVMAEYKLKPRWG
ncbi:hypothetical protein [Desulfocurvus vexinensis]|uniref:hypothetical protein n=1 Tax=Desulfocurvus vexinensis TaxID=399548 RepID=UPI0012EC3590|nr:hypothetical protein [Desulfocurvus vexinensis]